AAAGGAWGWGGGGATGADSPGGARGAPPPAVVRGLRRGVGAGGALMAKSGLRAGGVGMPAGPPFSPALIPAFHASDTWIDGAFALEQGFIFTAMILAAATVAIIERRIERATAWCELAPA